MSSASAWWQQLRQEWLIPEVAAARCVHTQCEIAECVRCVDICPQDAWILQDDSLSIQTDVCDGCGLCGAACTEAALDTPMQASCHKLEGRSTLLFACEANAKGHHGAGVVPCLHALSSRRLMSYYQQGFQQIISCRGVCEQCPRYTGKDLFRERLHELNQLLVSRQAAVLRHATVGAARWWHYRQNLPKVNVSPSFTQSSVTPVDFTQSEPTVEERRGFLGVAVKLTASTAFQVQQALDIASEDQNKPVTPWAAQLPQADASVLWPFVPVLDEERCNACDACVRLCPHDALTLDTVEALEGMNVSSLAYCIHPELCTGCELCVDSCDVQAVSLHKLQTQVQKVLPLYQARCKACGTDFHYPAQDGVQPVYCRICAKTNHHRNLFQVLS
ncbi:MAG: 4Fe-4S ferredoxin [Proteobacteria bacterium]|nr:MAG: 4Fe-4S ferredoxin [Pseudomonadota bacterium]